MKKFKMLIAVLGVFTTVTYLSSCGGSDNSTENADESTTTTETSADEVVDTKAKSDSKGVGKFTAVEIPETVDKEMAAKGQAIFESKCTPCHKMTEEKLVGPGLKNVTNLRTPEWIMNMITNPEEMTKKDPIAKALFEEHLMQMTFQNVSDDEALQIYEYLRLNDQQ